MLYYSIVTTTMGTSIQSTDMMSPKMHEHMTFLTRSYLKHDPDTMNYVLLLEWLADTDDPSNKSDSWLSKSSGVYFIYFPGFLPPST